MRTSTSAYHFASFVVVFCFDSKHNNKISFDGVPLGREEKGEVNQDSSRRRTTVH